VSATPCPLPSIPKPTITSSAATRADDREHLRRLLAAEAFLEWRDGEGPRDKSGRPLPWLFYGPQLTLTPRGLELATAVLLDRLRSFSSTQLATYGVSALPLLGATVAAGGGRYTGLAVRRERKAYGSCRRIDGPIDRSRSVVVIDESITVGRSVYDGIRALEAEGLEVEGALCLVEFTGYGAVPWLAAAGYRVDTVYDVWEELGRHAVTPRPTPIAIAAPRAPTELPEGLAPAQLARAVATELRRSGEVPELPAALDRPYDSAGGTFVSVRRRADDVRLARDGFRRDGELPPDPARDVALATEAALRQPGLRDVPLDEVKLSVSLLGEPDEVELGGIEHERYGLIVRGVGVLDRVGAALPNAPHYDDEIQQYRYARTIAAGFSAHEPTRTFRQPVVRDVEPGEDWPPYGAPPIGPDVLADAAFAAALHRRLRGLLADESDPGAPLRLPAGTRFSAVGVSLYHGGVIGCALSFLDDVDAALAEATARALADTRWGFRAGSRPADELVAVVSLLGPARPLGRVSADRLPLFFRLGRDTLMASAGDRHGLILAHFAVEQSTDARAYRAHVLEKGGIADGSTAHWTAYETAAWRVDGDGAAPLDHGFPVPAPQATATALAGYILGQRDDDGIPAYAFEPWNGRTATAGPSARILLAVAGLLEAAPLLDDDTVAQAEALLDAFLDGAPRADLTWDNGTDAQLLATLGLTEWDAAREAAVATLIERLRPLVRADGAIYHLGPRRVDADLDILSGLLLLALGRAAPRNPDALAGLDLDRVLAFYRRRFALLEPWSMVWWHAQAWTALADAVDGAEDFAFALVDWALRRQSATTGAFVIDSLPPYRISFLSACVLEAAAAAWERADGERAARYAQAWHNGMRFVERLVIHERDAFFSPAPERCAGGVRATLASAHVRIDFPGHALLALAKGARAGGAATATPRASRSPAR
jgi:orotate phosphoribosyltransferase/AMMECR1 domain-containing protein